MDENTQIRDKVSSVIADVNCYPFLFIGSGLSMRYMHTRTWRGLLEWVCNEVIDDEFAFTRALNEANNAVRNGLVEHPMPYVATLLESDVDNRLLMDEKFGWFRNRYTPELKAGVSPMKLFIADDLSKATVEDCEEVKLLSGPCSKKLSGVITTNYDHLAEWLFPKSEVLLGAETCSFGRWPSRTRSTRFMDRPQNPPRWF